MLSVGPRDVSLEYVVSTSHGKKGARSPDNPLSQGTSTPLPAHSVPGIPEYLSGSSNMSILVLNPPVFFLLLAANLALYGPGAILIREAKIRWNKGWASVFLMGAAYGIVEEGLALRTLFNPASSVVGNLGVYGHWLGVNWVWTVGLVIFHSVFSIGLPIFIFGLAFPDLKPKSLVSTRGIQISILALVVDSVLLSILVNYWPAEIWGLLLLSSIVVALLVVAAKKLPADFLKSVRAEPRWRPRAFFLLGVAFFPIWLLAGGFAAGCQPLPAGHHGFRHRRFTMAASARLQVNGNTVEPGPQSRVRLRTNFSNNHLRHCSKRIFPSRRNERLAGRSLLQ